MASDDTIDRVAALHDWLEDKKKAAGDQFSASKERLQDPIGDSSQKNASPLELRDLLNKLRQTWREHLQDEVP